MVISAETVLAACAVTTIIGGIFMWAVKLSLAPFKELIRSNTQAMTDLKELVMGHTERLDNQETRIVKIETKHSMYHRGE